jgi:hypothetical protein
MCLALNKRRAATDGNNPITARMRNPRNWCGYSKRQYKFTVNDGHSTSMNLDVDMYPCWFGIAQNKPPG